MQPRMRTRTLVIVAILVAAIVALLLAGRTGNDADSRQQARSDHTLPAGGEPPDPKSPTRTAGQRGELAVSPEMVARAEADQRCARAQSEQYRTVRDGIDPTRSPEQAVTHALLTRAMAPFDDNAQDVQREAMAALQRWPGNLELAWLAYNSCHDFMGCDQDAAQVRLEQADGDNLFARMPPVQRAVLANAPERFARAVRHAADAPIYDSREGFVHIRLSPPLQALPVPESCAGSGDAEQLAARSVSRVESLGAMPGLAGLLGCRNPKMAETQQARDDCKRLLERYAQGESLLEQDLALQLLLDMGETDPATLAALRERYRRVRWLQTLSTRDIDGFAWRRWAEGEVNVLLEHARQTGRWPPPDGWLPEEASARARITGD